MMAPHGAGAGLRGPFDVLVVGGGIVGTCVALDAATRDLRVGLIDRDDFGSGATANCLKIVHGGLRYLQHLDLRRVRESSEERSMWLRSAPHLVEPLPVVLPTYRGRFPPRWALAAAVAVNEALSYDRNRRLDPERVIPRGRVLSRRETVAIAPELEAPDLTGGILYHDAIMYSPERLTLELVVAARAAGVEAANHVELESAILIGGRVAGARLRDRISGESLEVETRWIVNAAGSSAPDVIGRILGHTATVPAHYSIALNLVTRQPARRTAFTLAAGSPDPDRVIRSGPRQLFVVPWRGQTMVGTAHFPYEGVPSEFRLMDEHVERFLAEIAHASPAIGLEADQVAVVHRGLLPVTGPAAGPGIRLLKRPRILDHADDGVTGALSVVSIKFTTARRLGRAVVDRIVGGGRPSSNQVAELPLPGAPHGTVAELTADARNRYGAAVSPDVLEHLLRSYGVRYEAVLECRSWLPDWDERVAPGAPVIRAQLAYGAETELARTVEDLLWRRTELGPRGLVTAAARECARKLLAAAHQGRRPGRGAG
jgi:glycerol-3-phosphate dehydrogenase